MTVDTFLDTFALSCFRDMADGDYVLARAACRCGLGPQFLWLSQQAIEKYLKCILLLNRVPATDVRHDIRKALSKIHQCGKVAPDLSPKTTEFMYRLERSGPLRYLELPHFSFSAEIVALDGAVWELRRYCTTSPGPRRVKVRRGVPPPKVVLPGGCLEKIIDDVKSPAREPLLWQNAFFGKRSRIWVSLRRDFLLINPPLSNHPELLDEVLKYVYLPKGVKDAYRSLSKQTGSAG